MEISTKNNKKLSTYFHGRRILVTGGAGFIAHHVIDKILSSTDWHIVTLDRLDFSGNLNRLNEVVMSYPESERKRVRVIHHDLKAAKKLCKKDEKVIKVPNTNVFKIVAPILNSRGISRIIFNDQLIAL